MKHEHHVIPKHAGGENGPTVLLTIEEHAEAHRKLYEHHGRWQDRLAWQMLSGQIGKEEAIGQIISETNKRRLADGTHPFIDTEYQKRNNKKRVEKGTHHFLGGEIQRNVANKRIANGTNPFLKLNNTSYTCPHCNRTIKTKGNYIQHIGRCRNNVART
jgi:hypothetical protein